jgi:heme/copper-type cytochrome/quinol oxidase subunit 1
MGQDIGNKPLLTLGVLLILTGIIFVVLGIIAELLIRIYFNLPEKKQYSVKRIFPESEEA